jgi:hypothetical protein
MKKCKENSPMMMHTSYLNPSAIWKKDERKSERTNKKNY